MRNVSKGLEVPEPKRGRKVPAILKSTKNLKNKRKMLKRKMLKL